MVQPLVKVVDIEVLPEKDAIAGYYELLNYRNGYVFLFLDKLSDEELEEKEEALLKLEEIYKRKWFLFFI